MGLHLLVRDVFVKIVLLCKPKDVHALSVIPNKRIARWFNDDLYWQVLSSFFNETPHANPKRAFLKHVTQRVFYYAKRDIGALAELKFKYKITQICCGPDYVFILDEFKRVWTISVNCKANTEPPELVELSNVPSIVSITANQKYYFALHSDGRLFRLEGKKRAKKFKQTVLARNNKFRKIFCQMEDESSSNFVYVLTNDQGVIAVEYGGGQKKRFSITLKIDSRILSVADTCNNCFLLDVDGNVWVQRIFHAHPFLKQFERFDLPKPIKKLAVSNYHIICLDVDGNVWVAQEIPFLDMISRLIKLDEVSNCVDFWMSDKLTFFQDKNDKVFILRRREDKLYLEDVDVNRFWTVEDYDGIKDKITLGFRNDHFAMFVTN